MSERQTPPSEQNPAASDTRPARTLAMAKARRQRPITAPISRTPKDAAGTAVPPASGPTDAREHSTTVSRPYRIPGELERADQNIEPLPPTPITAGAEARLAEWGVPPEFIDRLREIISSFRYDLVPEKAARMAKEGAYLLTHPDRTEEIVVPGVYDYGTRGDGECTGNTLQLKAALEATRYLAEVNEKLTQQGKPPLAVHVVGGQSRTHFTHPPSYHVWNGLLPEGAPREQMITVDSSMQEISTADTNQYRVARVEEGPTPYPLAEVVRVGTFRERPGGVELVDAQPVIAGISSDRQVVYQIGFARNASDKKLSPMIGTRLADGTLGPGFIVGSKGTILPLGQMTPGIPLTEQQRKEMRQILNHLKKMRITSDRGRATELRDASTTIVV